MTKLRKMRWAGHVACWKRSEMSIKSSLENMKEDIFEDQSIHGRMTLKLI